MQTRQVQISREKAGTFGEDKRRKLKIPEKGKENIVDRHTGQFRFGEQNAKRCKKVEVSM